MMPVPFPGPADLRARLRLRHMEVLVALIELRSLHKAAHRLHMTQPGVGKLLREIEGLFGATLFERSPAGLQPTTAGRALARKAGLVLAELDGVRDELAALAQGAGARVRLGAQPVTLLDLVPRLALQLRQGGAPMTLAVHEGANDVLLNMLARGELDCVLGRLAGGAVPSELHHVPLFREQACVVARAGHPLAGSRRLSAAQLAAAEWVLPPPQAPLRLSIEAYFIEHGLPPPPPAFESVSLLANEALLRATDMLGVLPREVARHYAQQRQLVVLPTDVQWPLPPVGLITRVGATLAFPFDRFMGALLAVVPEVRDRARQQSAAEA